MQLIEQADYVSGITAIGGIWLTTREKITIPQVKGDIQTVFSKPQRWRHTGLTRKDVIENNQKAQRAKEIFGELPMTVLNREIDFGFLLQSAKL